MVQSANFCYNPLPSRKSTEPTIGKTSHATFTRLDPQPRGHRGILYSQKDGLQSVGTTQRLKSFFDVGDARQKNAETLTSIHQAIINDPRFFTRSVQQKAVELLSQVRADRTISATQIRSIVDQLDKMAARFSDPVSRNEAARDILEARYASAGCQISCRPSARRTTCTSQARRPCPTPQRPLQSGQSWRPGEPPPPRRAEEPERQFVPNRNQRRSRQLPHGARPRARRERSSGRNGRRAGCLSQNLDHLARIDWGKCPYEPVAKAE